MALDVLRAQLIDRHPAWRVHFIILNLIIRRQIERERLTQIEEQQAMKGKLEQIVVKEVFLESDKPFDLNFKPSLFAYFAA